MHTTFKKNDHHNFFLACAQLFTSGKSVTSTLHVHSLSAYYTVLYTENSTKSVSTITPAIKENIWNVWLSECTPVIDWKVCMCCSTMMYHYSLFPAALNTFQAKNTARSAPASTALTQVSLWNRNALPLIVTCVIVEKGMEHKGEQKVSSMMQALELLRLAKMYITTLNSEEIKPVVKPLSSYACLKVLVSK